MINQRKGSPKLPFPADWRQLMCRPKPLTLTYFAFSILIFIILGAVEFFILVSFSNSLTLSFNCKYSSVSNTILCSKISYKSIVIYFY
nr:MAG TPA: Endothelial cell-specific chemotaxis regulator [Caudoviricetes sp.]